MDPSVEIVAAVVLIAVIVAALLICCSKRKKGGQKPKEIQKPPLKVEVEEPTVEPEVVQEEMVAVSQPIQLLAETPQVNTLYELFEKEDVDLKEVASQANSLGEVAAVIAKAGLETCHLIFGIDYTGSNYLQGKKTFGGKCLHDISKGVLNPYQSVITTLGETLEPFDTIGAIPTFGFGDSETKDITVFKLKKDGVPSGFKEVFKLYNQVTPKVKLGSPTNFAPLINQAIEIVKSTRMYHILVIVADGQVTKARATTDAIVEASNYPISIITVGVGDGPWDTMMKFDEQLPVRKFDNFHFVDFAKVTKGVSNKNASFALHALKEIPDQYKAIKKLQLLPE